MTLKRLLKEAQGIVLKNKVKFIGSIPDKKIEHFDVTDNQVHIKTEKNCTKMSCTCKHCSLFPGQCQCAHQLAVILYLYEEMK